MKVRLDRSVGLLLVAVCGSCGIQKTAAPITDGGHDVGGAVIDDGAYERPLIFDAVFDFGGGPMSCGGTVNATGTTPMGSFSASDVYLDVGLNCGIGVLVRDTASGTFLAFSLVPASDDGAFSFLGQRTERATLLPIQGGSIVVTTVIVTVTAADDPYTGSAADAQPIGRMDASFTFSQDGFSLSGSFSSPYCQYRRCPNP